ncbi:MAG: gluconate 2-dehydrogenase subunit 3 family protein [Rhodanobacteraceae bacterium]
MHYPGKPVTHGGGLTRRRFLEGMALAVPGAALLGCGASPPHAEFDAANAPGPQFLTKEELAFVNAAIERLIPGDAKDPGAKDAGVATFIDRQLSGPYGAAQTWYLKGPWPTGDAEQGYQSRFTPAQMYRVAIASIDAHCRKQFRKAFAALDPKQRDDVLHGLEKGDIKLPDTSAKQFFEMLWNNTQQGFLADPMYGGNRNFAGWKLVGFPGPRYNYTDEIEQYGKRYTMPTVGLRGGDPKEREHH